MVNERLERIRDAKNMLHRLVPETYAQIRMLPGEIRRLEKEDPELVTRIEQNIKAFNFSVIQSLEPKLS